MLILILIHVSDCFILRSRWLNLFPFLVYHPADVPKLAPDDDAPDATVNAFQELEQMADNIMIGERGKASTISVGTDMLTVLVSL